MSVVGKRETIPMSLNSRNNLRAMRVTFVDGDRVRVFACCPLAKLRPDARQIVHSPRLPVVDAHQLAPMPPRDLSQYSRRATAVAANLDQVAGIGDGPFRHNTDALSLEHAAALYDRPRVRSFP